VALSLHRTLVDGIYLLMIDNPEDLFAREFEASAASSEEDAAKAMLAKGMPAHFADEHTPPGHVMRRYPDGREELVRSPLNDGGRLKRAS